MELQEMQAAWQQMNQKIEKQQQLTDQLIMEMTTQKYRAKYQKLNTFETVGGVICYVFATYILMNFGKMDIWYLRLCAVVAIAVLTILPIFSLSAIRDLQNLPITSGTQKELMRDFTARKRRFLLFQKINVGMTPLLMVSILPIFSKLFKNIDVFTESSVMFWYLPIGAIALFLMFGWVFKCYRSINASAAKTLEELDQQ
ncbi:hypothetical protein [Gilvibacter sediminis]|uniref:hypothetical protein n=1 Tax=Gilvibacter sediminis TaxID=379071 RepID=UPI00234FF446|nr:hypothetical protein [Gilvibacter sediminis]MDC7997149.1 hypothetical protein [Gilvibacter sediminis]